MPTEDIRQEGQDKEETHRELRQKIDELRREVQGQIEGLRTSTETQCSRFVSNVMFGIVVTIAIAVFAWLSWYCAWVLAGKIDKVEDGVAETRTLQQEMNRRVTILEEREVKGK